MNCPKCQAPMRTVDREGIHVEQCSGCRGVFLDAGELEAIVAAEDRYYREVAANPPKYQPPGDVVGRPAVPPPMPVDRPIYRDSPPPHRGYRDSPPPYGRRRKSFLESLFD